ncbi:MAG: hypothetical protein IJ736_01840 [Firmicutes bacterium]|nr:hypothetical protein [Bacillota bacterium]
MTSKEVIYRLIIAEEWEIAKMGNKNGGESPHLSDEQREAARERAKALKLKLLS